MCLLPLNLIQIRAGSGSGEKPWDYAPTADEQRVLASISARSLLGHLSFLASDALEGRATPSRGQTIAAEYIAAQFRRAGLEAVGNDGYFAYCRMKGLQPNPEHFRFSITGVGRSVEASPDNFDLDGFRPVRLVTAKLVKVPLERSMFKHLRELSGKVVITEFHRKLPVRPANGEKPVTEEEFLSRLSGFGPRLLVVVDRDDAEIPGYFKRIFLPDSERLAEDEPRRGFLTVTLNDPAVVSSYDAMDAGDTGATLSMNIAAPLPKEVVLRNVAGLLRGSDPALKDTYVLVSAHYDGTGSTRRTSEDRIWNAANDDGSGTVSVIEIASALAALRERPRRSVIFAAFFGEEKGLFGSRCYARNPPVPLEKTIANLNLEQLGRTDSLAGDQKNKAIVTGFDYSEVGRILQRAGEITGIGVAGGGEVPDPYFLRSDNFPFAEEGIPAHTVCVALEYPDYHKASDEWDKIDYENMERTDRMIALAVLMLAQRTEVPSWNGSNSFARPFFHASQKLHSH